MPGLCRTHTNLRRTLQTLFLQSSACLLVHKGPISKHALLNATDTRLEITKALRTAALAGDVGGLKLAIARAEHIGLESEAELGRERLSKLEEWQ